MLSPVSPKIPSVVSNVLFTCLYFIVWSLWLTAGVVHPLSQLCCVRSPHVLTIFIFFILLPGVRITGLKTRVKGWLRSFSFALYSAENCPIPPHPFSNCSSFFCCSLSPLMDLGPESFLTPKQVPPGNYIYSDLLVAV